MGGESGEVEEEVRVERMGRGYGKVRVRGESGRMRVRGRWR